MGKRGAGNTQYNRIQTIEVDGQMVRPVECMWVVYDPEGVPRNAFPSDVQMKLDVARAARSNWYGDTNAIIKLNQGWHLDIMTMKRFLAEVAPKIVPLED